MTSHAEDEIGEVLMGHDLNDLWHGEVTVPADEGMGSWPVAPQIGKEPDQDRSIGLDHNQPYGDASGGALCCVIAPLDF
jgi:hypothetical protein